MKHLKDVQSVDLPDNRLGREGGAAILDSLSEKVRKIDVSSNQIGSASLEKLVHWIDMNQHKCMLEVLNISNNSANDKLICDLAEVLVRTSIPLKEIDFSKNKIGNKGGLAISELINVQYNMRIVKIGWN